MVRYKTLLLTLGPLLMLVIIVETVISCLRLAALNPCGIINLSRLASFGNKSVYSVTALVEKNQ